MENNDQRLYLMLGKMEGMLESILTSLNTVQEDHKELRDQTEVRLNEQSKRLHELEKFQWRVAGISSALPVALTIVGWFLLK